MMTSEQSLTIKVIPIVSMDCPTCIPMLENGVKKLKGVNEARGNYISKTLKVAYDPKIVQLPEIERAIERLGYQIAYKKYPSVISKLKSLVQRQKPSSVQPISDADFSAKVLNASKPVAVLFSSQTCPACQSLKPIYGEAAEDLKGRAEFYEMDVSSSETWRRYNVHVVPMIIIFREGQIKEELNMLPKKDQIEKALGK
jgi:thiol-disulfide isomerase/thioredoxin